MGTAIVVTSGKGGVGKSTVSLGLASQFAAGGERVLLLDCDAGLRSLDRMTGTEEALVFDSSDVVAGRCAPADAIYPCVTMPGVSLMPAPASGEDLVPERVMLRLVPLLKRYFDRVILDSPAGVGRGLRAAAAAADCALIVCNSDPVCIRDASIVRRLLTELEVHSSGSSSIALTPNISAAFPPGGKTPAACATSMTSSTKAACGSSASYPKIDK